LIGDDNREVRTTGFDRYIDSSWLPTLRPRRPAGRISPYRVPSPRVPSPRRDPDETSKPSRKSCVRATLPALT